MYLRVIPFFPGHLDFFKKANSPDLANVTDEQLEQNILHYCQQTNVEVQSIIIDNRVLAICGLEAVRPKVCEVLCVFGEGFRNYKIEIHKKILDLLAEKEKDFHRLQMTVLMDYSAGIRWAESLGFENEGLMRHYDEDKRDYYRFARVH